MGRQRVFAGARRRQSIFGAKAGEPGSTFETLPPRGQLRD